MHLSSASAELSKSSTQPSLLLMAELYLLRLEEVLVDAAICIDHLWGLSTFLISLTHCARFPASEVETCEPRDHHTWHA